MLTKGPLVLVDVIIIQLFFVVKLCITIYLTNQTSTLNLLKIRFLTNAYNATLTILGIIKQFVIQMISYQSNVNIY